MNLFPPWTLRVGAGVISAAVHLCEQKLPINFFACARASLAPLQWPPHSRRGVVVVARFNIMIIDVLVSAHSHTSEERERAFGYVCVIEKAFVFNLLGS